MNRDEFREAVFKRDGGKCVVCPADAQDAHHIIERRLWPDGGYHLDNGVSLCAHHHHEAEKTFLSCDALRAAAGITQVLLPEHLDPKDRYDKWGNVYIATNRRLPGELFWDSSVQKVLFSQLGDFEMHVKHPRTLHLPWSNATSDDVKHEDYRLQRYGDIVITEKMDGENTTMYNDYIHARSLDSKYHPSRTWVKNLHGQIKHNIPAGMRICGENLFAKHSIHYDSLPTYFMVFAIWEGEFCLSWEETLEWCELLGLMTVPVLWGPGIWLEDYLPARLQAEPMGREGYVIRPAGEFTMKDYRRVVGKYVRPDHVTTTHNWMNRLVVPNGLANAHR